MLEYYELEDKAEDIKKELLSTKRQAVVSEWLQKMQEEADIIDNRDKYMWSVQ